VRRERSRGECEKEDPCICEKREEYSRGDCEKEDLIMCYKEVELRRNVRKKTLVQYV
jgi:hypothetical protein